MSKFDILSVALESKATIEKSAKDVYEKGTITSSTHIQEVTDGVKMFIRAMIKNYESNGGSVLENGNFENFVIGMMNLCTLGSEKNDNEYNELCDMDLSFSGMVNEIQDDEIESYRWLDRVSENYLLADENVQKASKELMRHKQARSMFENGMERCVSKYFGCEKVFVGGKLVNATNEDIKVCRVQYLVNK